MIRLKEICKTYNQVPLFDKLSCNIQEGDLVTIMGKSGSGKSTLLNIIGMFDGDFKGEYYLNDRLINSLSLAERERIRKNELGYIFQNYNLINEYTVLENVELPLGYRKIGRSQRRQICIQVLEELGLKDKLNAYPQTLSGGEQQRVSIARTLVMNPKLLLADEPTGSVDQQTAKDIITLFEGLNQKGVTIIMVTHDPNLSKIGNKQFLLNNQRLELV